MLYLLLLAFIVGCIMLNAIGKPPGLPTATVRTETETVGSVRAELTIGHDVTLRIWRRGQLAFGQPLTILQTSTYDGPSGFDIRVDGQGEPFVRIGVVTATSAGQKRFPDDLRLEYRFDRIGRHYVASLIPGKFRDPLWSGTVAIRDVTRAGDLQITASYSLKNDEFVRVGPTLSVARQGVAVPIGPLPSGIRGPLSGSPVIVDLNNDAELEIVYSLSMLGTNCC